jgi:hypothetical protein
MPMGGMPMGSMPMGSMPMGAMSMSSDTTSTDEPPMPVTTFRPFGAKRGAVNLATTYQRQLGGQAQPVVAAWQTPREVAFTAIGLDNKPQTVLPGAEQATSLAEAIVIAERMEQWPGPTWITGGQRIYAEGLPLCERLLITRIDRDFEGDRFFPADWQRYFTKLVSAKKGMQDGLGYAFEIWER